MQLELEDVDVSHRVHTALDMRHVRILECANDERRRVDLANVPEKAVAKPLTTTRAAHETGDVRERHRRRDNLWRLEQRGQTVESRIGDGHDAGVRFDGRERIVADGRAGLRHRVEERRLPRVWQSDDADTEAQILSSSKAVCSARTASRTRGRSMMQVTWISLVAIIWMLMPELASARKIFA